MKSPVIIVMIPVSACRADNKSSADKSRERKPDQIIPGINMTLFTINKDGLINMNTFDNDWCSEIQYRWISDLHHKFLIEV